MRFLGPSVWSWWTWLHGYNLLCIIPRCVLPGLSLLKGRDTFIFLNSFPCPGGQILKKIFSSWNVSKWLIVAEGGNPCLVLGFPARNEKKNWKNFRLIFLCATTLIEVNTAKVRRTVWKQWKFIFKYFSWHILKVLIATITRETSEILKSPRVRSEHQETFHFD